MDLFNQIRHNQSTTVRGFGLNVDDKFITVPARQLNAPNIQYANSKTVTPFKGAWNMDDRRNQIENCTFLITNTDREWGILNTNVGEKIKFKTTASELHEFTKKVDFTKILSLHQKLIAL